MQKTSVLSVTITAILALATNLFAAEPKTEKLWPDGTPGARGEDPDKDMPKLYFFLPGKEKATGAAVVICPGGGYGHLATEKEGFKVARWLNGFGVAGIVVDYRHKGKGYGHPAPLQDAQRAIRTVRDRAKELHITPDRIGIMGFSAGGHLASTAGTHFDAGDPEATDPIEKVNCRPDFLILCYPVIAFGEPFTHFGSQRNLIGPEPSPELVKSLSNEKQVTRETPPTFLWHTTEDRGVKVENCLSFYAACSKAGVPAELHVFEKGRHGLGLAEAVDGTKAWPRMCENWMRVRGLLKKD